MSAIELLPCPFCGGEAASVPDPNHSTGWDVGCFSGACEIEPHVWAVHHATAIVQWNCRTDLSQASVAAALEAAASVADAQERKAKKRSDEANDETQTDFDAGVLFGTEIGARVIATAIRALITPAQHDALAAHVAAEVAKARAEDAVKIEALTAERDAANLLHRAALREHTGREETGESITEKYLRRYPRSKKTRAWEGAMVHLHTQNGIWRPDGHGYTLHFSEAWVLPLDEARRIVSGIYEDHGGTYYRASAAALSTPATEPQGYVEGLEAALRRMADGASDNCEAEAKRALAARPAPQPAADTRVDDYDTALAYATYFATTFSEKHYPGNKTWQPLGDLTGLLTQIDNMVAGIIGNATPAPSDKIAEAADVKPILDAIRALLKWDAERRYPLPYRVRDPIIAALRALAGQGETP